MDKKDFIIENEVASFCLHKEGVLKIIFKHAKVNVADMKEITKIRNTTPAFNLCLPVLLDITNVTLSSLHVLKYGKEKERTRFTKKLGLIVNSPASRIVGNLFLNFYTPKFPIHLFSHEKEAMNWLKQLEK